MLVLISEFNHDAVRGRDAQDTPSSTDSDPCTWRAAASTAAPGVAVLLANWALSKSGPGVDVPRHRRSSAIVMEAVESFQVPFLQTFALADAAVVVRPAFWILVREHYGYS